MPLKTKSTRKTTLVEVPDPGSGVGSDTQRGVELSRLWLRVLGTAEHGEAAQK